MITSTIIWSENLSEAPGEEELLIWVCDDSGDTRFEYTTTGWRIRGTDIWITNNERISSDMVKMWAKMPS